jgi:hypothetical protein
MNFFKVLLNPQLEEAEAGERGQVSAAANVLQVGEFQFLQLAYHEWFGKDLPEASVSRLFSRYMVYNEVPHWARHYARLILTRESLGSLDSENAAYHRYDCSYQISLPTGMRQFLMACGIIVFVIVGAITIASQVATPGSLLPPYFERSELQDTLERND